MKTLALILAAIALALVACQTPAFLTPPKGKGTPYECGYWGTKCGPVCCDEGFRCIAPGRCQIASYEPPNLPPLGARGDGGAP